MHMFNPPHPGDVLRDYLDGVSITQAASRLQVSRSRLSRILNGHAPVTADMALRLAALLNTRAELWTGMQSEYGLWQASQNHDPLSGHCGVNSAFYIHKYTIKSGENQYPEK